MAAVSCSSNVEIKQAEWKADIPLSKVLSMDS